MWDDEGLVNNFEVHSGKIEVCLNQPDIGAYGNIVVKLLENLERHKVYEIFVDNWYRDSFSMDLNERWYFVIGIIRANRLTNCKFLTESELKKSGRGSYEVKKATLNGIDVLAIKWMDNRLATMLTSNDSI